MIYYNTNQKTLGDKIYIKWDDFSDAVKYELQYYNGAKWIVVADNITSTSYLYTFEQINPTAQFRVRAIYEDGESEWVEGGVFEVVFQSFIDAHIVANARNKVRGYVDIIGYGESDLDGSIAIKGHDGSSIDSVLKIEYKPRYAQINSEVVIARRDDSDIDGELFLKPSAQMRVNVDIVPPPKRIKEFLPVKDSVVRQSAPTINYGDSQQMLAGETSEGKFISYLGFNLDLPDSVDIISAKIVLYKQYKTTKTFFMGLYETSDNWEEHDITYEYRPIEEHYLTQFVIPIEVGQVEVDITDIVLDWYKEKGSKSFILRPRNYSYSDLTAFGTKESLHPPLLVVEYYESVENAGSYSFDAGLVVRRKVVRDVSAVIDIESDYIYTELGGEIELARKDLDTSIGGKIVVSNTKYAELDSSIELEKKIREDALDSSIIVPFDSCIESSIKLEKHERFEDLDSVLIVRALEKMELNSLLDITRKDLAIDVEGNIIVKQNVELELDSLLNIDKKNFVIDVDGSLTVRQKYEESLDSSIGIERKEVLTDIGGGVVVRREDISDLDSTLDIMKHEEKHELDAELYVLFRSDIDANIEVPKVDSLDEVDGEIEIIQKQAEDLFNSNVIVRVFWVDEFNASIDVERKFEIDGSLLIERKDGISELECSLIVDIGGDYAFIM